MESTHQISFRILTLRTENKFFNESIQHVLQLIRLMRSIDNVTVILNIKLGLCSQLTTKKFGRICKESIVTTNALVFSLWFWTVSKYAIALFSSLFHPEIITFLSYKPQKDGINTLLAIYHYHFKHKSIKKCCATPDYLHVGGRLSAFATSTMLTITVFIPFPLPST